ncbi:hypothetical protein [Rubinisphaera margarita]|uniref:hypothetical protein n=1 Tax=Rubinisphaera margarita TaxID=2909586 RepID=UPI001EE81329|nr:hypothetical protein [Rubinisphaera margarita]MCG6157281.1 hypothetical protein [Rubinisphaera margarita]
MSETPQPPARDWLKIAQITAVLVLVPLGLMDFALRYRTPEVAFGVTIAAAVLMLLAVCLAIATKGRARLFWISFLILSLGTRYLDTPDRKIFYEIPTYSTRIAEAVWPMYQTGEEISHEGRINGVPSDAVLLYSLDRNRLSLIVETPAVEKGSPQVTTADQGEHFVRLQIFSNNAGLETLRILIREFLILLVSVPGALGVCWLSGFKTASAEEESFS